MLNHKEWKKNGSHVICNLLEGTVQSLLCSSSFSIELINNYYGVYCIVEMKTAVLDISNCVSTNVTAVRDVFKFLAHEDMKIPVLFDDSIWII